VRGDRGLDEAIPSASPIEEPIPPARPVEEPILPVSLVEEPIPPASPAEEPIPTMPQVPIQTVDLPRRPLLEVIAAPVAYPAKGLIWSERAVRLATYTVFTYVFVRPLLAIRFLIPRLLTVLFSLAKVPFLVGRGVGSAAIIPLVLLAFYPWLWLTTPMVTKMQSVRSVGNKVFLLMAFPMVLLSVWVAMVMNYVWSQAIGVPVLLVRRLLLGVSLLRPGSSRTLFSADRDPSPL